jgi:hypothetical protein
MIGWTIGGRVHQKSNYKKVTHPSADPAIPLSSHGILVKALDLSQPSLS